MKVECPSCGKHHQFKGTPQCGDCGSSFVGTIFKKKPFVTATSAVAMTAAVFVGYDRHYREDVERYPLAYEYELVEYCASSDRRSISLRTALELKNICLCAVEGVAEDLSFDDFLQDQHALTPFLRGRILECDAGAG